MMDEKKKNQAQDVVRLAAQEMENEITEMSEEELEEVSGGLDKVTRVEYGYIEMPDEPQLTYLKNAIKKKHCRCGWAPTTEDQVNDVINNCVLQGNNGYYCPRCNSVIDATSFYYQLYRA